MIHATWFLLVVLPVFFFFLLVIVVAIKAYRKPKETFEPHAGKTLGL